MDFITIVASDYDSALKQARSEYGPAVRIQTRKDFFTGTSFTKKSACEISFYLVEPKTEENPCVEEPKGKEEPVLVSSSQGKVLHEMTGFLPQMVVPSQSKALLEDLLKGNDFGDAYIEEAASAVLSTDTLFSKDDFEMKILEYIIDSISIDHASFAHPPKYFVLLGPTGVGKTTTLVKIAMLYSQIVPAECQLKVAVLSLDSFRAGAFAQIETFCNDLHIDLFRCAGEGDLSLLLGQLDSYDLVLVDTMGKSPKDGELALKLKTMLSVLPKKDTAYYLAVSASHKQRDMDRYFQLLGSYTLSSIVVTKTDETENVGNILSFSKSHNLPLLFMTDGQKVPQDLHKASNELILSFLDGFSLDFRTMGTPQSTSMQ
ncbi:flagellar GTP-binding protein [Sphaerochaeta pleomorpha str. Grapes]|uniref:Flagellar biosynthesis protein FlhF n=1 Tax=Sphaerochaeta pleomorpha (strain ATCC BAA-1885 / DSM 22778 / Grapes) TaxID=158190 RepID=G8QXD1_SPHPG|nr:flagellar GTP-binding protein [Sphaerochaeta pleomorpha]AEV28432.1 flagellar GTP-binding protein [Sphaerochaeta pleomorpha str. Grapes]